LPREESYATVTTFAADLGNTAIYPALTTGGCLHVIVEDRAADPEALAAYFQQHRVGVLKIVPSHLNALLSCSSPERVLPRRTLVLGGEPCPWTLIDEVQRLAPGCRIFNHYGPTETTVGATVYPVPAAGERPPTTTCPIGTPLSNLRAYVLDSFQQPLPPWVPGELYLSGAGVARGYLNAPELDAQRFLPDRFSAQPNARMYRTGDGVRRLPSGDLEFLSRVDDQVKIRGYRVELGEIAAVLRRHPSVREAVALLRDDVGGEKRLVAYVVCRDGEKVSSGELRDFLAVDVPEYMIPSAIGVLKALPLSANGKIDRAALPDLLSGSTDAAAEQPATPWESLVAQVWRELLHVDEVSPYENFYDLGGHSLLAVQVVTALEKRTGVQVSPRDLVFHTLRQFAALCEARGSADALADRLET
jgi:acyl-coenzyme A synthetase/AMP-(fatty) acid ligase/acyl carrier protein